MAQFQSKVNNYNGKFRWMCSYTKAQSDNKKTLSSIDSLPDIPKSKRLYDLVIEDTGFERKSAKFYLSELQEDYNKDSLQKNILPRTYRISEIKKEFTVYELNENGNEVKFKGPKLSISCLISDIKTTNYERKIGFIKTSIKCEKSILDCRYDNKPFYSTESYKIIPAHEETQKCEIKLIDFPNCRIPSNTNWKFQQFFVYLVEESMENIEEELKYDVLFSFDWFSYLKLTGENNNIFEYKFGINEHIEKSLPGWIMKDNQCHDKGIQIFIEEKTKFKEKEYGIYRYPNSFNKKKLNMLEKVLKDIEEKVSNQSRVYEDICNSISKLIGISNKKCEMVLELVRVIETSNYTDLTRRENIAEQESIISEGGNDLSLDEDEDYEAFKHFALTEKEYFELNRNTILEMKESFSKCQALKDKELCENFEYMNKIKKDKCCTLINEALNKTKNNGKSDFANKQDEQSNNN